MKIKLARFALRISLIYAAVGCAWILLSGLVLFDLSLGQAVQHKLEIFKGLAFVVVTAVLLYVLLHRRLGRLEDEAMERKRAEESLRNNECFLRLVMDLVPHFIFVKDRESHHLLVNRACAEACKLTPEQMIGRSDLDLAPDSALAKSYMQDDQEVIASGRPKFVPEQKLTDAYGRTRFLQTTKIPFPSSAISLSVAGNGEPAILGVAVDITERRKAEDALRESHAQLTEALQIAHLAYWEYDVASDQFTFNDQFYNILRTTAEREGGYTMSSAEYAKRFVHPDDRAMVREKSRESLVTTDPNFTQQMDHRIIYGDGEVGYFNVHVRVEKDAQGRTIGTRGANMDITERKRSEWQVAESGNYLSKIINSITDPIFVKDRQHRWVLLNEAFCDFMEHQRSELLGKSDCDFFPKQEADVFWAKDELVFSSRMENINEEKFTDGKGMVRTILTKKVLYTDDKGEQFILGIIRDITDRKMAEEELHQLNQSLQTLSKCNETLVRATDENSLLTEICQIITEVGGYRMAWVGYTEQDEAKSVRPVAQAGAESGYINQLHVTWADTELGRGPVGTAIRTGQPAIFSNLAENPAFAPWQQEALRRGFSSSVGLPLRAGQKTFGVLCVYSSRPDAFNAAATALLAELADDLAFGISSLRNRSERNHLEEQLRQSQKMEAIGRLAGGVAHDFNNMLTVIQGSASLLLNPQLDPKEWPACSRQIVQAAERAAGLTRQLLIFSRKQALQPADVDLNEVVDNVTKMLRRILGEDIVLQTSYAPQPAFIHADIGMIEQVLMNLLVNARDAMPSGGQLRINTDRQNITEAQVEKNPDALAGPHVCLTVSDTGCGIPKENLPRIFDPFFTTKEVGKGTGLGLATVYSIVQQHRGWITVTSEVNKGTTFKIYFPVVKGERVAKEAAPQKTLRGSGTILVVEDELAVRTLVSHLLQRCGYTVLQAESGADALKIWQERQSKIQLLLTDIVMPDGINGYELARQLQAAKPKLKVIYTSGYSNEVIGKGLELTEGVNFLQKPYVPQKLLQILHDNLNGKEDGGPRTRLLPATQN